MNIVQHIAQHAANTPNSKALVYGTDSHVTYAELMHRVRQAAGQLSKHQPGTHVGLLMRDTWQQVAIRLASMQTGVIAVPLTARVPKPEFDRRAGLFELATIYADADYPDHLSGYHVTRVDDFDSVFSGSESTEYRSHDHDRMSLAWSGGTHGTPDGVYYSHNSMRALADASNAKWSIAPGGEVYYPVVPQFGGAFVCYLMIALTHGHALVIESQPFSPAVVANNIINHGVTHIMGTASVFNTMLRRGVLPHDHVPRMCVASGDAVSVQVQREWREHYGTRLIVLLASSQYGGFCEQEEHHPITSIGTPWPCFEVRLLDEQGVEVPDGEAGQLWVRSPACAVGDVTANGGTNFDPDGWVTTNDMLMRHDGVYYMVGRKNDTFKVNGQFVGVLKIEDRVRDIIGVADAVAVPAFDNTGLPRVKVYVVAQEGARDVEKIKHAVINLHGDLLSHERPRLVEILDEIPRHPGSQKIQRFRLNPLYNQEKA